MTTQGPLNGGTFTDDATVGSLAWVNPGNAATSNDVTSDCSFGSGTGTICHYLRATNFGFTIPTGANIDGVTVGIERRGTGTVFQDSSVRLYTGSFVGSDKASVSTWPTTDAYATYGGAADVWGAALTDTIVNASTFGVGIAVVKIGVGSENAKIDHIRITVDYTAVPASGPALSQTIVVGL